MQPVAILSPTSAGPLLRSVVRGVRERAERSDLLLVAAALTCYAVLGVIPILAVGIRVAAALIGRDAVVSAGQDLARFAPGSLGIDRGIRALCRGASTMSWMAVLGAVLPASLYAEGIVRALERFSQARENRSRTLRGRALTIPLILVAGCAVVVIATVLRPLLTNPFGTGAAARLLGILVGFLIMWAGATALLCLVYRLFAATPVRPVPLVVGAAAAGSWLAGQTLGYVLVLRYISGFAHAYGGVGAAGAAAAIVFLVYLDDVVVLLGYLLALRLHEDGLGIPDEPGHDPS
jgi:membrane protein